MNRYHTLYTSFFGFAITFTTLVWAGNASKELAYPEGTPSPEEIAQQVYYVNHFYAFSNISLDKHPRGVSVVIDRTVDGKLTVNTVERHINNTYRNGDIRSRELAIFQTGKLKRTGILLTEYEDPGRSQSYAIWLPALRMVRVFEQADPEKSWGGTVFTYGDMSMRRPGDEQHELLGTATFSDCLGGIDFPQGNRPRWKPVPVGPVCDHRGKEVYLLKSQWPTTGWWYDYRISYVDVDTFGDYRTEYYKDEQRIKVVERDWRSTDATDPRALQWHHLYGKHLISGKETYIVVPGFAVKHNMDKDPSFWSEETLRGIGGI